MVLSMFIGFASGYCNHDHGDYDAGFNDGANEAALDIEPILTENQYKSIPRRTLFRMKDLQVLK